MSRLMQLPLLLILNFLYIVHVGVSTTTPTPNLGELCPGQNVVLTCSTTDGNELVL